MNNKAGTKQPRIERCSALAKLPLACAAAVKHQMVRSISIPILAFIPIIYPVSLGASTYDCAFKNLKPADRAIKKSLEADLVFIGTVSDAYFPSKIVVEPEDLEAHLTQTVIFDILSSWKGQDSDTLKAKVSPSCIYGPSCSLEKGVTYLAYGYIGVTGQITVSALCWGATPIEKAEEQMQALDDAFNK